MEVVILVLLFSADAVELEALVDTALLGLGVLIDTLFIVSIEVTVSVDRSTSSLTDQATVEYWVTGTTIQGSNDAVAIPPSTMVKFEEVA